MLQNIPPMSNLLQSATVKLPPINESGRGDHGALVAGTDTYAKAGQQHLIYRSVPPKQISYTFTDMFGNSITPGRYQRSSIQGSLPSDYAKRFKERPTTKPKVVQFNAGQVVAEGLGRPRVNGFFPPVKLRKNKKNAQNNHEENIFMDDNAVHLAPTSFSDLRAKSAKTVLRYTPAHARKSPDSIRTAPAGMETAIIYPSVLSENLDYDDLSLLPPPKRILPKRELPWVFRYKVKKNMNELAKIMASKPQTASGDQPLT